jgi:hypothetical protein
MVAPSVAHGSRPILARVVTDAREFDDTLQDVGSRCR